MKNWFRWCSKRDTLSNIPAYPRMAEDLRFLSIPPGIPSQTHSLGLVLLHMNTGTLFATNEGGARFWNLLLLGKDPVAYLTTISNQYSLPLQQIEADTVAFAAELVRQGLLTYKID